MIEASTDARAGVPPGAPTLIGPPDCAMQIDPGTSPFVWSRPTTGSQPITYRLQFSLNVSFAPIAGDNQVGPQTQAFAPPGQLAPNTSYYWRVIADNEGGSTPSNVRTFRTGMSAMGVPPGPPAISAPLNGATGVPTEPALAWTQPATGTPPFQYGVEIAWDPTFTESVLQLRVGPQPAFTVPPGQLGPGATYFWRVVVSNPVGTNMSAPARFTTAGTAALPAAPVLIGPPDAATAPGQPINFNWNLAAGGTGPVSYVFQWAANPTFAPLGASVALGPNTANFTTAGFPMGAQIFWRVGARNGAGTAMSAARSFTLGGMECNRLANTAPAVQIMQVAATPPNSSGGVPVSGRYYLTAYNVYTGPGGPSGPAPTQIRQVLALMVSGTTATVQIVTSADGGPDQRVSGMSMIIGTTIASSMTCGGGMPSTASFSVTGEMLRILQGPNESVFTYQGP